MDNRLSDDLWLAHENLVRWTTWRIVKRYGGDFDELFSEAMVIFCTAAESYEPILGSFSNWITFHVYKGLQEVKRTQARHLRITGAVLPIKETVGECSSSLQEMWKDLSAESQHVLMVLADLDQGKFKNKSLIKLSLRTALLRLSYSNDLITSCFREIEAALG